jgi:hypothetical protein
MISFFDCAALTAWYDGQLRRSSSRYGRDCDRMTAGNALP